MVATFALGAFSEDAFATTPESLSMEPRYILKVTGWGRPMREQRANGGWPTNPFNVNERPYRYEPVTPLVKHIGTHVSMVTFDVKPRTGDTVVNPGYTPERIVDEIKGMFFEIESRVLLTYTQEPHPLAPILPRAEDYGYYGMSFSFSWEIKHLQGPHPGGTVLANYTGTAALESNKSPRVTKTMPDVVNGSFFIEIPAYKVQSTGQPLTCYVEWAIEGKLPGETVETSSAERKWKLSYKIWKPVPSIWDAGNSNYIHQPPPAGENPEIDSNIVEGAEQILSTPQDSFSYDVIVYEVERETKSGTP